MALPVLPAPVPVDDTHVILAIMLLGLMLFVVEGGSALVKHILKKKSKGQEKSESEQTLDELREIFKQH